MDLEAAIKACLAEMDAALEKNGTDPEGMHSDADTAISDFLDVVAPEILRKRVEMDRKCGGFWYA